jgi:DNA helicase-2/ATP-dependent DNA helicase PcrA
MLDTSFPHLNQRQREAVYTTEGPVLILAGAGSGKTTVLVNRIAYILHTIPHVMPYNVLAITFTNKAAAELKERLVGMLGMDGEDVWARTFHSACVRFLRRDIEKIGYTSSFSIFDTSDQLTVVKECLSQLNLSDKNFPPKQVLSIIGRAKDELLTPEDFAKSIGGDYRMNEIAKVYRLYQDKLKAYGALDFDDIIMLTVRLLEENPSVLSYYQKKFKYILVDEYQDTNHAQYRLVSLLAGEHRNLCVVGDDDQSIYKFRGANIENILNFEEHFPEAKVIKLEENYRSTQNILDAANHVIKNNLGRKSKSLWTSKGKGDKITLYRGQNEYDEAGFIVETIESGGMEYKNYAVLYRTNAQSRVIEKALTGAAIPYRVFGGLRFYDRKEIKDIVAYLRLFFNRDDNASLKRIINEPKRGIGKTTLDNAQALATRYNTSIFNIIKSANDHAELARSAQRLLEFAGMIEDLDKALQSPLTEFLQYVLVRTGYLEYLESEDTLESRTRLENIVEFVNSAREYEQTEQEPSLGGFLDNIALVSDVDNYDEAQDAVVLMTLHSAKGLEFPVVFLAGMEEGVFPSYMSIGNADELEEERRLAYVGITRAQEKLCLTCAATRTLFGSTTHNQPSRFVEEIPSELIDVVGMQKEIMMSGSRFMLKPQSRRAPLQPRAAFAAGAGQQAKPLVTYVIGERVQHRKFGEGIILKATPVGNDWNLEVAFDSVGTKILMAAYANLKKM